MDLRDALQSALGSTYTLERELGGGGMSRVFLATERSLERPVVLKVLPPELAHAFSADRFRQEIRLAAKLQHPHIVPLLAAGEAGELLYYSMPYVDGESLRARLARSGELAVKDAVRILRDVAAALAYAHEHGVVHRDIKPDNVLLSGGEALVTDFGVAKALSASATPGNPLTSLGVALGTPAYMAPEQGAADPQVDHRADIYAWGCLAYETLSGQQPFVARTSAMLLMAHATERPEALERRRPAVPPALAALVMRCLEKRPADRPQRAEELLQALEGVVTPSGGSEPTVISPALKRRPAWIRPTAAAAGVAVVAIVLGLAFWHRRTGAAALPLDDRLVAVFPFRVSGADSSLGYLREGMVDLLAAKLTGEGGPRAADPRSVLSAWRRETGGRADELDKDVAGRLARGLGAGRVLLGSVVGSPAHLVLSATMRPASGAGGEDKVTVEGPPDSLPVLLDRLTAQLLARGAGEYEQRLPSLTTTSLQALRAYLDGRVEYRRGHYAEASALLIRAIQVDSGFALAAFALTQLTGWVTVPDQDRVIALAWRLRDRLSPRDQGLLAAEVGPRYPEASSGAEDIAAEVRAVEAMPDLADAWFLLGDTYFHNGKLAAVEDADARATVAFRRAIALDSNFAAPLGHLAILDAVRGDTAELRRVGPLYLKVDSMSDEGLYLQWRMGLALDDSALLSKARARIISSTPEVVFGVATYAWDEGLDLGDVARALDTWGRATSTPGERANYFAARLRYDLNRGHPGRASADMDSSGGTSPERARRADHLRIAAALYWDGDTAAAAAAARRLSRTTAGAETADSAERVGRLYDLCWLEQWRLAHGDTGSAEASAARLRALPVRRGRPFGTSGTQCGAVIEALLAVSRHDANARPRIERLDSMLRTHPAGMDMWENLLLSQLLVAQGDTAAALAALRRRTRALSEVGWYHSTYLREEGRLAALTGDRDGAVRAWSRYLAIRSGADPALRPEVDSVKAELGRVVGEPR